MAGSRRRRVFASSGNVERRTHLQRRGNDDAENPGNTLYVTDLTARVTEKDLEEHFSGEGKVIDCRLVVEPRTRISRGFGFVTMDSLEDAEKCIKYLNQSILGGRFITVEKSRRKRPRTPTPGKYLGDKSTREFGSSNHGHERRRGYNDRDGRMYSPRRSPYRGGGSRRERSRTLILITRPLWLSSDSDSSP